MVTGRLHPLRNFRPAQYHRSCLRFRYHEGAGSLATLASRVHFRKRMESGDAINVLAAVSSSAQLELRRIFGRTHWNLQEAMTIAETARILRLQPVAVVVCEAALPDGDWRRLLYHMRRYRTPPPLIVAARNANDALWMEVLEGGAYNLLAVPFQDHEVFQVISAAWQHLRGGGAKTLTA